MNWIGLCLVGIYLGGFFTNMILLASFDAQNPERKKEHPRIFWLFWFIVLFGSVLVWIAYWIYETIKVIKLCKTIDKLCH